jgi:ATP-dependent DNA helicase DinG
LGALPEPVKFSFSMLKGRANYLCTRRLQKAMQQSGNLFTSSEAAELQRIYQWSQTTADGSLSDFDIEPDLKVWSQVCSERGLCSPKICGHPSDFARDHGVCFFQRARNKILSSDVLILNHTLFFTLLGGIGEEIEGGILFKNDFVIFDEAHTVQSVASRHIGLSVSNGQMRYALNRLWNPRTEKGLLATLRKGGAVKFAAKPTNFLKVLKPLAGKFNKPPEPANSVAAKIPNAAAPGLNCAFVAPDWSGTPSLCRFNGCAKPSAI